MAKIFVSHAHEDRDAAHQITFALAKAGHDPWLNAQELRSGDELLKTVATVLAETQYFVIVLSRTALTKSWVLTELRMAVTAEIERAHPKVIVLRLDECEVPIELRHKVYLDFRGRFDDALKELAAHVSGVAQAVPISKQTVLAEMIANADAELWERLSAGATGRDRWKRSEAANVIRDLRSNELDAAVCIGSTWSGQHYKVWDSDLVKMICRSSDTSDAGARRIVKRLAAAGFLEEANDLDYSGQPERAWCDGSILWILRRAARRSGLFPSLPPPMPERLSTLLAYGKPAEIIAKGWYAVRFAAPVATALDTSGVAVVAVSQHADPGRTWVFRSADDRAPLRAERYFTATDLTPSNSFASISEEHDLELVGFDLATFDDLSVLRG
jgi:hypothetical protein